MHEVVTYVKTQGVLFVPKSLKLKQYKRIGVHFLVVKKGLFNDLMQL